MAFHNWAHVYREIIPNILPATLPSVFYSQSAPSHLFFHLWTVSVCKDSIVLQLGQLFLCEILVFLWDTTIAFSVNSQQHYQFLCHVVYFLPQSFLDLLTCFSPLFLILWATWQHCSFLLLVFLKSLYLLSRKDINSPWGICWHLINLQVYLTRTPQFP